MDYLLKKLQQIGIPESDIDALRYFRQRGVFTFAAEDYLEQFSEDVSDGKIPLMPLLGDWDSNYVCVYTNGPLKGMVCIYIHDMRDLAPVSRTIKNFLNAVNRLSDEDAEYCYYYDFVRDYQGDLDFPLTEGKYIDPADKERRERLIEMYNETDDKEIRSDLQNSIYALTPKDELENTALVLLEKKEYFYKAIDLIDRYRYTSAVEKLVTILEQGKLPASQKSRLRWSINQLAPGRLPRKAWWQFWK